MRSRFRPSHATVVAYVALFVALGGTAVAANGGNFILGQSNTAGNPTQLTSPTTNAAGALKVTSTASSGGRAIQGTSAHGQGVYGHSGSTAGVVGDSNTFDGVFGVSNDSDSAGVSGHGDGGGYGLFATGGNRLFHTAAIHGESTAGNAIEGFTTGGPASGVYGQDNNANSYGVAGHSNNGVAVAGDSSSGWAMQALGNATQSRAGGGFVKAMAFVDPFASTTSEKIKQSFNSRASYRDRDERRLRDHLQQDSLTGRYTLGFGFQVNDRFVSASAAGFQGRRTGRVGSAVPQLQHWCQCPLRSTSELKTTPRTGSSSSCTELGNSGKHGRRAAGVGFGVTAAFRSPRGEPSGVVHPGIALGRAARPGVWSVCSCPTVGSIAAHPCAASTPMRRVGADARVLPRDKSPGAPGLCRNCGSSEILRGRCRRRRQTP